MEEAARNVEGRCILYADKVTKSMKQAMEETQRRRKAQELFNQTHNIVPKGIQKKLKTRWKDYRHKQTISDSCQKDQ